MIQIKKQSGNLEDFDRGKVRGAIIRAGASPEMADRIVT
jgi:hypothetical protein